MLAPLATAEVRLLAWSIVLFIVHMVIQGATALGEQGAAYNAGPRDEPRPLGRLAGRARRAFENYKETWPVFIALALGLTLTGRGGATADAGAWIWFLARIVYLPLYLFGVPWLRTAAWGIGFVGLVMMLTRLF